MHNRRRKMLQRPRRGTLRHAGIVACEQGSAVYNGIDEVTNRNLPQLATAYEWRFFERKKP
jgi:hypothetical protein